MTIVMRPDQAHHRHRLRGGRRRAVGSRGRAASERSRRVMFLIAAVVFVAVGLGWLDLGRSGGDHARPYPDGAGGDRRRGRDRQHVIMRYGRGGPPARHAACPRAHGAGTAFSRSASPLFAACRQPLAHRCEHGMTRRAPSRSRHRRARCAQRMRNQVERGRARGARLPVRPVARLHLPGRLAVSLFRTRSRSTRCPTTAAGTISAISSASSCSASAPAEPGRLSRRVIERSGGEVIAGQSLFAVAPFCRGAR